LTGQSHRAAGALGKIAGARENGADGAVLDGEGAAAVDRHVTRGASEGAVNERHIAQDIVKKIHIKGPAGDRQIARGQ